MAIVKYENYVDVLAKEFSEVEKESIKDILHHGLDYILKYRKLGTDFYIRDDRNLGFYMYIGDVSTTPYERNAIYFRKRSKKVRHMYRVDKIQYDGYYYFSLSKDEVEIFEETNTIATMRLYKVKEECLIHPLAYKVYRLKVEEPEGWLIIKNDHTELNAEYIGIKKGNKIINETSDSEYV